MIMLTRGELTFGERSDRRIGLPVKKREEERAEAYGGNEIVGGTRVSKSLILLFAFDKDKWV